LRGDRRAARAQARRAGAHHRRAVRRVRRHAARLVRGHRRHVAAQARRADRDDVLAAGGKLRRAQPARRRRAAARARRERRLLHHAHRVRSAAVAEAAGRARCGGVAAARRRARRCDAVGLALAPLDAARAGRDAGAVLRGDAAVPRRRVSLLHPLRLRAAGVRAAGGGGVGRARRTRAAARRAPGGDRRARGDDDRADGAGRALGSSPPRRLRHAAVVDRHAPARGVVRPRGPVVVRLLSRRAPRASGRVPLRARARRDLRRPLEPRHPRRAVVRVADARGGVRSRARLGERLALQTERGLARRRARPQARRSLRLRLARRAARARRPVARLPDRSRSGTLGFVLPPLGDAVIARRAELAREFARAEPFPHLVIDDFFDARFGARLLDEFPPFEQGCALDQRGEPGGKSVQENVRALGPAFVALDELLRDPRFLALLGEVTGIPDLLYDPAYIGGGTHENRARQDLDPHVDFNYHPTEGWERCLNLLVYLNRRWE